MKFPALIIAAFVAAPASAWAIGNPQAGQELALNDCSSCHGPSAANAKGAAPQFGDFARDSKRHPDWMHGWMSETHHAKLHMNRQQMDDVMAYLGTFSFDNGKKRG